MKQTRDRQQAEDRQSDRQPAEENLRRLAIVFGTPEKLHIQPRLLRREGDGLLIVGLANGMRSAVGEEPPVLVRTNETNSEIRA